MGPVYYVIGALLLRLTGTDDAPFAALEVLRLAGLALVPVLGWLTYRMARDLGARAGSAALASGLLVLNPTLLAAAASAQNDYLCLVVAAVAALVVLPALRRGGTRRSLVVGALVGLAVLVKVFAGALLVGFVVAELLDRRRSLRPRVLDAVAAAVGTAVVSGWWFVRNLVLYGDLTGAAAVERTGVSFDPLTRVIVAGSQRNVDDIAKVLRRESWLGKEVIGAVVPRSAEITETPAGHPVIGHTDTVVDTVLEHGAESVVFVQGAFPSSNDFRRMAWELEKHHVNMIVVPALSDVSKGRINVRPVAGLPLVYVEPSQRAVTARLLKRAFDIIVGSLIFRVLSPVMLVIALALRLHDGGPVFFRQSRVGQDGTLFTCLKFRSMVPDADTVVHTLVACNEADAVLFKMREDPRVTRPGRFMRRYSLDETPQILNVIRGHMSLVGPRPPLPSEVERYHPDVLRRLRVRPGMTGLWQVSGRSDLSWEETVRLDLYYVDNWTMLQDIVILLRTVRAVLGGRGAY